MRTTLQSQSDQRCRLIPRTILAIDRSQTGEINWQTVHPERVTEQSRLRFGRLSRVLADELITADPTFRWNAKGRHSEQLVKYALIGKTELLEIYEHTSLAISCQHRSFEMPV